jgi:hypothetical protein
MAKPDILRGTYVNILIGDGAEPEVFTPICGLTARTFTDQINTSDAFIRDCADPEDVPKREIVATGEQWDLTGTGLLDRAGLAVLQAAKGTYKNYRFELAEPTGNEVYGGYWAGEGMLTSISINGPDGDFTSVDISIASNGEWTETFA